MDTWRWILVNVVVCDFKLEPDKYRTFSFVFESFDAVPELMLLSMSISLGGGFGSSRDPSEEDAIVDRISLIFLLLVACDLFSLILSFRNRIVASYRWITRNRWILKLPVSFGIVVVTIDCHLLREYPVCAQKLRRVRWTSRMEYLSVC